MESGITAYELFMGGNDPDRCGVWCIYGKSDCSDQTGAEFGRGGSYTLYYDGRGYGFLGGADGNRTAGGDHPWSFGKA